MKRIEMKTPEVRAALRARHSSDRGWVCLEECFNIDFLAFACHGQYTVERGIVAGSRHPWVGYEIKVSRSDFRAEMRKPHKRAWGVAMTNEFYFCAPRGLIKPHEVPEDCGLLEVTRGGSKVTVRAPLTEVQMPTQLHLAQMLRHGIEPGFIRAMAQIKASAKWRERQADEAMKDFEQERQLFGELLAERLGHTITVGSSWKASRLARRQRWFRRELRVTVSEVTATTVRYESPELITSLRLPIGDFLREFEPSGARGSIAA